MDPTYQMRDRQMLLQNLPANKQLRWPSGKSVRFGSCRLGFDSKSGQTNDFKIGIHSFPA